MANTTLQVHWHLTLLITGARVSWHKILCKKLLANVMNQIKDLLYLTITITIIHLYGANTMTGTHRLANIPFIMFTQLTRQELNHVSELENQWQKILTGLNFYFRDGDKAALLCQVYNINSLSIRTVPNHWWISSFFKPVCLTMQWYS